MSRPRFAGFFALCVVAAACGTSGRPAATPTVQVTRNPAAAGTPATVGAAAGDAGAASSAAAVLQFTATRLGGGTVDGTSFAGKPVAFWFWAPG